MGGEKVDEIVYPISLQYRKHWTEWDAIREIVTNCMDETEKWQIQRTKDGIVFRDYGSGMKRKHFIVGVSEKKSKEAIGRFGEGFKFACFVMLRLGYKPVIRSRDFEASFSLHEMFGETCVKVSFTKSPKIEGTEVTFKGYHGPSFADRFISANSHHEILWEYGYNDRYKIIKPQKVPKLYVGGIYMYDIPKAVFSYNLPMESDSYGGITMTTDRTIKYDWEVRWYLYELWRNVDDLDLLVDFLKAIKHLKWESNLESSGHSPHSCPAKLRLAWKKVFGERAVIYTSDNWEREAKYRRAKVIKVPDGFTKMAENIIPTDREYVMAWEKGTDVPVPLHKLSNRQRRKLETCQQLVNLLDSGIVVAPYLISNPSINARATEAEIRISVDYLERASTVDLFGTIIHELAHIIYGTRDVTVGHIEAITKVGARLLTKKCSKIIITEYA